MVGYTIGVSNRRDEGMKFGSLFAGVGGFDLGFEAAGMECCFQVEWDKYCQQVLAYHWPDVPRWSDVSDVKGADLPPVDVITFGSPCQDLSVAGKRAGLDGGRSNLFFEATRIIREMRDATDGVFPRVAVWENVPGAFSSNEGHDFGSVLDGLAESGALGVEWGVLDARWFGVPQRRRRIFVVAEFDPARAFRGGEPVLAIGKGSPRDLEKIFKKRESATGKTIGSIRTGGITGSLSVSDLLKGQTNNQSIDTGLLQVVERNDMKTFVNGSFADYKESEVVGTVSAKGRSLNGGSEALIILDGTRVDDVRVTETETAPTLTSRMGTGGNTVPMMAIPINHDATTENHGNGFGIGEDGDPSGTLTCAVPHYVATTIAFPIQGSLIGRQDHNGPGKGFGENNAAMYTLALMDPHFVATDYQVRRLTEVECERLMGWPDNHTLNRADGKTTPSTQRYKMCGNGVASPVAKWVGEQILAAEPPK
jgi:DNA (cytosine-5)-methyltransferase 1